MVNKVSPGSRKIVLALLMAAALALGGYFLYTETRSEPQQQTIATKPKSAVDQSQPSSQDRQEADAQKDDLIKENAPQNGTENTKPTTQVVLTEASTSTVRGYVTGVFEDGGTCKATAKKGPTVYVKESTGFKNVSYTQCKPVYWDTALSKGSWLVELAYTSSTGSGSISKSIEVN